MNDTLETADAGIPGFRLERRRFAIAPRQWATTAVAAVRAHADTVIFPAGAILAHSLALYSGIASFGLRLTQGNRLPATTGFLALGTVVGELVLPRLLRWSSETPRPRIALWLGMAAVLLASPVTVAAGLHDYIYNDPWRMVCCFTLGLSLPPAYHLYFSRFPARYRGLWYGISIALGVVLWRGLLQLAANTPHADGELHHPFLAVIYPIHVVGIALTAFFCLLGLCRKDGVRLSFGPNANEPLPAQKNRRSLAIAILGLAFLVNLVSGLLQAELYPMAPVRPQLHTHALLGLMAVIWGPLAGWMLDRQGGRGLARILSCSTWFFIVTPATVVMSDNSWLHTLVQALGVGGWFMCDVGLPVSLAALARNRQEAGRGASLVFLMVLASSVGWGLAERVFLFEAGAAIAAAIVLIFIFHILAGRIRTLLAPEPVKRETIGGTSAGSTQALAIAAATLPEADDAGRERFLDTVQLTPREREAAVLLLRHYSTPGIARTMGISKSTAKKHTQGVLRKFGAANRQAFILLCAVAAQQTSGDHADSLTGGEGSRRDGD